MLATVLLASCRDPGSSVFPSTPLGELGVAWLTAHNRAEGHAMVHFTMVNRGTALMSGAQTDSAVYAGVKFAQELGPLVPIKLLYSSDTSVTVLLRSANRGMWRGEFTSAAQPSLVKVHVRMDPSS
jgi:hypothetical protein